MPLNLNTTDNNLENQLNSMYGVNSLTNSALGLFKQYAGVGEAVVNIMGLMGIAGFKFNIPEREQIKLQSEITDHYTDTNNPVQDHIAKKPITITLTGIHGEYFYTVNPIEDTIAKAVPALSLVTQFLPTLSAAQQQVLTKKHLRLKNSVSEKNISGDLTGTTLIGGGVNYNKLNGVDLFTIFQDLYKISKRQSRAYLFFEALWERQALFSVETSWKRFDNMAVESITPLRTDSADKTEFTITVKQMSFTQTKTDSIENVVGRLKEMLGKSVNKGIDKGQEVPTISGAS